MGFVRLSILLLLSGLGAVVSAQDFRVRAVSEVAMPARPDSNSPAFWRDGRLFWYGSHGSPWLNEGPNQFGPWTTRPAAVPSPDNSPKWMEAVWPEENGVVWGWYHAEPVNLIPGSTLSAPKVGAAVSFDGGYTMNDLGFVLASGDPIDPAAQNTYFAGGHGDPSVILDRQQKWFYFFFGNYGGPAGSQGVCIARMAFEDRFNPSGTVWKYHNGAWQEPGLGGQVTPIFPVRKPWGARDPDAFWGPAVHWNRHLNCYVMLLNRAQGEPGWSQEGVYISFSPDLSRPELWTTPRKVLDRSDFGDRGAYYAQVMGLGPGDTDRSAGETARLYLHGVSRWEIDFLPPATGPMALALWAAPTSGVVRVGETARFSVSAMGLPPFTYQWFKDGFALPQATSSTLTIPGVVTTDAGTYSVIVGNALGSATSEHVSLVVTTPVVARPVPEAFISNLSVRARLAGDDATLTLGYALLGDAPKALLTRAIGPTLALFGVPEPAVDPRMVAFDAAADWLDENDNWDSVDAAAIAAAGAFPLPEGSLDSALTLQAPAGTGTVRITSTGPGVVLAEIYDPAPSARSKVVNVSARGRVGAEAEAMIGGFAVSGSGNKRLLIRGIGPYLAAFGVGDALTSAVVEVHDQNGYVIAVNEGWGAELEPDFAAVGAWPLPPGSRDAAVVVTLAAGSAYTAVLRSGDGSSGEALLEIYELP